MFRFRTVELCIRPSMIEATCTVGGQAITMDVQFPQLGVCYQWNKLCTVLFTHTSVSKVKFLQRRYRCFKTSTAPPLPIGLPRRDNTSNFVRLGIT